MDSCFRRNDIGVVINRHSQASYVIPKLRMSFPSFVCHSQASYVIPAKAGIQGCSKRNTNYPHQFLVLIRKEQAGLRSPS
jgi:hypothetical protein